ncbi:Alcohol dehydrogenase (NADP(+)) [Clostridium sp. DL-VIII]|uniref:iron-containing alcohol dehydrogenase n=1 Tax=Clostridium sp. DL-VIII TaxID=641107 RepID=UPI00023AF223|nr:iron-containing alcohol dehydrogenase [Clostridium sp. DL-VIII]EHI97647.1 Alcohol dehydrogenase (NADP(+)) [Clostridium sp. DL-VIII]
MNNFIFENTTKIYFGRGCVKEYLANALSDYGDNVMFAYGSEDIKQNGIYGEVMEILNAARKNVIEFSNIMPNPTYEKVLEGTALAKENAVEFILGVGGEDVLDCCKAISMAVVSTEDVWNKYWGKMSVIDFEPLPLGVIVTVAGTGSEMNGCATITNEKYKVKTGRDYLKCNPKFAMIDPEYTYSVSADKMVSGGFDTLTHIMETYFSEPNEDNVSDDISEALMRSVIRNLRTAIKNPKDYTARSNLMWACTMSENRIIKLGKKVTFEVHNIGNQLDAYTNCNHGCGIAVIGPVYYQHIYSYDLYKFARFARNVWNIKVEGKTEDELARAGIEALSDFIKEIGLPSTLHELGNIDKDLLKQIADSCKISAESYKKMTNQEILKILEECY